MKRYYVVWKGRKTGIFSSWQDCKRQVDGYPNAKFKSFPTLEDAMAAFRGDFSAERSKGMEKGYIEESISVDAASSGNPGMMEYRGVCTKTGEILFHFGPVFGTNNVGEFLAIVHALAYLKEKNLPYPVYSDSQTAIGWVMKKKAGTTLPRQRETERLWQLIERAEEWLRSNPVNNPILKWETGQWGEIRADFGRKSGAKKSRD